MIILIISSVNRYEMLDDLSGMSSGYNGMQIYFKKIDHLRVEY